jgi:ribosomal protein S18 acetylase RimI-like enzyme
VALEDDLAGEAIVGFCAVSLVDDDGESLPDFFEPGVRRGRVRWVSVAPERWRLGIGRRLTQEAVKRLVELACETVVLETTVQQKAAVALYKPMGFIERGRTTVEEWRQVWMELVLS